MTEEYLISKFQKINDDLNGAYETNDPKVISRLLSNDWTILEAIAGLKDKEQFLKAIIKEELLHTKMKKKVVHARLHNDVAIIVSKGKSEGTYMGDAFNTETWVTNIYKKDNLQWLCVMTKELAASC
jgi:hypothetical protein